MIRCYICKEDKEESEMNENPHYNKGYCKTCVDELKKKVRKQNNVRK